MKRLIILVLVCVGLNLLLAKLIDVKPFIDKSDVIEITKKTNKYTYSEADVIELGTKVVHLVKYNRSGKEVSFASQLIEANKTYVIHDDFVLDEDVTIPANCVLQFEGGSISGHHTMTGSNTGVNAGIVKIFNADVKLAGTWTIAEAYPEWFGAVADSETNDLQAIQKCIDFASTTKLQNGKTYCIDIPIKHGISLKSNTVFDFNGGSIKMLPTELKATEIIWLNSITNVTIINPVIIGDSDSHDTDFESTTGVSIRSSNNITIINPRISKCTCDGIYISSLLSAPVVESYNISLMGETYIEDCGRQGISIICGHDISIESLVCRNIYRMAPGRAIDIECNNNNQPTYNINIGSITSYDCWGTFSVVGRGNKIGVSVGKIACYNNGMSPIVFSYSSTRDANAGNYNDNYDFINKDTSISIDSIYIDKCNYPNGTEEDPCCIVVNRYLYKAMPRIFINNITIDDIASNIPYIVYIRQNRRLFNYTKLGGICINKLFVTNYQAESLLALMASNEEASKVPDISIKEVSINEIKSVKRIGYKETVNCSFDNVDRATK